MTQSHGLPQPLSWSHIRDISIRIDEGAKRGTPQCAGFWHKTTLLAKNEGYLDFRVVFWRD